MYTAAMAILDALADHGVTHLFANLGSDHPPILEGVAEARRVGRPVPELVTSPNEMVGLSAAHGFWLASGVAQAVLVHVDCGTQALGGAVHAADKGRAPVLILSGASPITQHGEMTGSRNEFIMWLQDGHDQRSIVRNYMRYDNEVRTGKNAKDVVHRAFQFAESDPKGPVYLLAPREILEEAVEPTPNKAKAWRPIEPAALSQAAVETIGAALLEAERPLLVTTYAGRNAAAVEPLVRLCDRLGVGVHESVPAAMNFPHTNPLYQGNQWNQQFQNEAVAAADVILVVDCDVPWIPTVSRPADDARIYHIDVDPLKEAMPMWRIAAEGSFRADAATALTQLNAWVDTQTLDEAKIARRAHFWHEGHRRRAERLARLEAKPDGAITSEYAVGRFRELVDEDMIFLNESISSYHAVYDHLALSSPGQIHTSGSGTLGWSGGAAVGMKLARPDKTPVVFTGDGTYMFSIPSTVHWMARRYETPFLTVIFNNRGWRSPKSSLLSTHGDGLAAQAERLPTSFEPTPDYGGIATAAGGAWSKQVVSPDDVDATFREALRVVREEKRCAVVELWLDHH